MKYFCSFGVLSGAPTDSVSDLSSTISGHWKTVIECESAISIQFFPLLQSDADPTKKMICSSTAQKEVLSCWVTHLSWRVSNRAWGAPRDCGTTISGCGITTRGSGITANVSGTTELPQRRTCTKRPRLPTILDPLVYKL